MKNSIRLLVENLFDDLYDIDQETNSEVDLADDVYSYKLGDIFYYKKQPYAICCGESLSFNDNEPRFIYNDKPYYQEFTFDYDFNKKMKEKQSQLMFYKYDYFNVTNESQIKNIDENGYENTQRMYNIFPYLMYPLLKYVKTYFPKYGYIPAITELQVLLYNKNKISNLIDKDIDWFFYSSTFYDINTLAAIYLKWDKDSHNNLYVCAENPFSKGYLSPFININKIKK